MPEPFHYHDPMPIPHRPGASAQPQRRHLPSGLPAALMSALLVLATGSAAQNATPPAAPATGTEAAEPVTNSALNAPLFYQLLLGELNVRSGEAGAGYSLILDAARKQKDPQLYRRAVEVALQARSGEAALGAAHADMARDRRTAE